MGKSGKKTEVFVGFIVFVMICVIVYAGYAFLGRKYSAFSAQSLAALASDQYELGRKCYENKDYEGAYIWYYRAKLNGHSGVQEELDKLEGKGLFTLGKLSEEKIISAQKKAEAGKNER